MKGFVTVASLFLSATTVHAQTPQYNLKNEFGQTKWTITTVMALIVR